MKGVGSRSAGLPSSASCQTAGLAARPGAILTDWQARGSNSLLVRRGGKKTRMKKKNKWVFIGTDLTDRERRQTAKETNVCVCA